MTRSIFILLLLAFPAEAQFIPQRDHRARRAFREQANARVPEARAMLESTSGDHAAACIIALPVEVGEKIASKWPEIQKLPAPSELFTFLCRPENGKEVALFALDHLDELRDPDAFTGFLTDGLEVSLALKPLQQAASEARARRLYSQAQQPAPYHPQQQQSFRFPEELKPWAIGAIVLAAVVLLIRYANKRKAAP